MKPEPDHVRTTIVLDGPQHRRARELGVNVSKAAREGIDRAIAVAEEMEALRAEAERRADKRK